MKEQFFPQWLIMNEYRLDRIWGHLGDNPLDASQRVPLGLVNGNGKAQSIVGIIIHWALALYA